VSGPVRAELVVDLDALRHNVRTLARTCAPAALMVVVKADGYGHGMVPVARAAREAGADWLGVATIDEALSLRASGDTGPLLCWLGVPGEDYAAAIDAGVDVTAYSATEVGEIVAAARRIDRRARMQLKVDTGLSRGGATAADWPGVVAAALAAGRDGDAEVTGVWSHFACADDPDHPANAAQEQAYAAALDVAEEAGLDPGLRHLCNSAGALTRPQARYDLVRCGLASYGLSPVPDHHTSEDLGLVPVMTARAQVAMTKQVAAGAGLSYGHTYRAARDTTVALVPVGYGDGVPVHGSSVAPVQVAGERRTISGRVCMDQFLVDVDDQPVSAGDEVVLFGSGATGAPTAQEWAEACGTISYEIVTRIGGRFGRRYAGTGTEQDDDPIQEGT
jgi:alanine racemase